MIVTVTPLLKRKPDESGSGGLLSLRRAAYFRTGSAWLMMGRRTVIHDWKEGRNPMEDSSDKIFVIQPDGCFGEVARSPYESEDVLQQLLEEHPELLAGETFEPGKKVRFLLVGREVGVPDGEGGSDR